MRWLYSQDSMRQRLLDLCLVIMPNSYPELGVLKAKFENLPPHAIVPNGVDELFLRAESDWFVGQFGRRDFVLCVGAINFRKNQLGLIRALGNGTKELVLVGQACGSYARMCLREAARALFIPRLEGEQLASAYAAARVHAMPSWYDTPGLTSLEALVSGCPVAATEFGCAREYFGSLATYCSPTDHASIRAAIEKASGKRPSLEVRREFQARFSWQEAAKTTAAAYRMAFGAR
jgi:glycosyltransferase involved in cell wall biosynthesis